MISSPSIRSSSWLRPAFVAAALAFLMFATGALAQVHGTEVTVPGH